VKKQKQPCFITTAIQKEQVLQDECFAYRGGVGGLVHSQWKEAEAHVAGGVFGLK